MFLTTVILMKPMNQAARRSNISKSLYIYSIVDSEEEEENIIQELDGCVEDIDSLLSAMNFEEYDEDSGVELYDDEEYQTAADYHNAMIRQEVPDWNKY